MAAANGHAAIVEALLAAGAVSEKERERACPPSRLSHPSPLSIIFSPKQTTQDPSTPNAQGNTPLHWACFNGAPAAVAALLAAGASPAALNAAERTPVDEAHARGDGAAEACLVAIREWAAGSTAAAGAEHADDVAEVEAAVNEEGGGGGGAGEEEMEG